ncbi:MAG: BatD family protein [Bacteroidales bacterium]
MKYIVTGFLFMLAFCAGAQTVKFNVKAPDVVEVNEVFEIQYIANTEPERGFQIREIDGLEKIGGPSRSERTEVSIVNGNYSQQRRVIESYRYRALKPGSVTIPPATIHVDAQPYRTRAQTIDVVGSASAKRQAQQQSSQKRSQSQSNRQQSAPQNSQQSVAQSDDAFVQVHVNKTDAYVGEAIYVSLKLYTKYRINLKDHTYPTFDGFYKKDIEAPQNLQYKSEMVNGEEYNTVLFKKMVIFPQKSGELHISPFELDCNILIPHSRGFWGVQYNEKRKILASKPIPISVKSLPSANKPSHFNGAVGQFEISALSDTEEVSQNEAFTYTIKVRGTGNMSLFQEPNITFPPDFEVYDPKVSYSLNPTAYGQRGAATYKYVIIPRHKGSFEIPEFVFSYFNPKSQSYERAVASSIPIVVTQGDSSKMSRTSSSSPQPNKEDVSYFGQDIRYIKSSDVSVTRKQSYMLASPYIYLWYLLPTLIFLVFLFVRRRKISESQDIAKMKTRKANKESKKRLKHAGRFLKEGNDLRYYKAVETALWGYISDKYTIPRSELSKDTVRDYLHQRNVGEHNITELIDVLEVAEFGQYTPNPTIQDKEQLYVRASEVIGKFEQLK